MPTLTTNFGLEKPLVNDSTDQDLWGGQLNTDMDDIDGLLLTALNFTPAVKTTTYTVATRVSGSTGTGDSKKLLLCDASGAGYAINLPAAATAGAGFTVAFKKTDSSANAITLTPNGAEKIDGAATSVLSVQHQYTILVSDGITAWDVISSSPASSSVANQRIVSNISGSTGAASGNTLTALLDNILSNTQGSIIYRGASLWSALGPGTSGQFLKTQGAAANPVWAASTGLTAGTQLVVNPYDSSTHNIAHGLGQVPNIMDVALVCLSADQGYSVGDSITLPFSVNSTNSAFSVSSSATTLYFSGASNPSITARNAASSGNITAANWKLVVTPYKVG